MFQKRVCKTEKRSTAVALGRKIFEPLLVQFLEIAEMCIECGTADAGSLHDISNRNPFVTSFVNQRNERLAQACIRLLHSSIF